ncbi:MAG: TRAP transporter substrate-binding protein DctP [Spirochaetales bacterium]
MRTNIQTKCRRSVALVGLLLLLATVVSAQTIRIGSSAPENSPWGRALNRLAVEWREASNGRVRVQVFHNSIAGQEADMIRKMRIGQLQAIVITNVGLSSFSDQVMTLSMPLLIRNEAEYDYVFERVREELEEDIEDDGFRVMAWSSAGWIYPFGAQPIRTPDDMQRLKLAVSPEEQDLIKAYQLMGYQPVSISFQERLTGLVNGMANGHLSVPLLAAGFQWFGPTPYMLDLKIAPAPGAILLSERAYRRLPRDSRDELMAIARRMSDDLNGEIAELERTAIETMQEYGLTILEPNEAERELWVEELQSSYDVMLGLVFHDQMYRRISEHLDEFRN